MLTTTTRTAHQTKQKKETEFKPKQTTYIDPFIDFAFKRLFSSEESKPVLIGLLNNLFKGDKFITAIEFEKNEGILNMSSVFKWSRI